MNMTAIKAVAKERGVKAGRLKKVDLVREIQGAEGNPQCFCTSFSDQCGQPECLWRVDCD